MALTQTSIDSTKMPVHFHYELPVIRKRQSFHQTIGGVRWLYSPNDVTLDSEIPWECNDCTITEMNTIIGSKLRVFGETYSFSGHFGENLTVVTLSFDNVIPKPGKMFDLSGSVLIYSGSDFDPTMACDGTIT